VSLPLTGYDAGHSWKSKSLSFKRIYVGVDGHLYFGGKGGANNVLRSRDPVTDGKCHHVAAQQTGQSIRLWIDGDVVAEGRKNVVEALTADDKLYWIMGYADKGGGDWIGVPSTHFQGLIDDVSIWNRYLPGGMIRAAWNGEPLRPSAELVQYWQFDRVEDFDGDGTSDEITNLAMASNPAQLVGASLGPSCRPLPGPPGGGR